MPSINNAIKKHTLNMYMPLHCTPLPMGICVWLYIPLHCSPLPMGICVWLYMPLHCTPLPMGICVWLYMPLHCTPLPMGICVWLYMPLHCTPLPMGICVWLYVPLHCSPLPMGTIDCVWHYKPHTHALWYSNNGNIIIYTSALYNIHSGYIRICCMTQTCYPARANGSTSESCNRLGSSSTTIRRNHQEG